jgi:hypothetical protein
VLSVLLPGTHSPEWRLGLVVRAAMCNEEPFQKAILREVVDSSGERAVVQCQYLCHRVGA